MRRFVIILLSSLAFTFAAHGQGVSTKVRTAAFLEVITIRGVECGLMRPWQAAALRALNRQDMMRWDNESRAQIVPEVERKLAESDCDDEAMRVWIEGSARGFDSEMLPPYLVAYRMLAKMDKPPRVFAATALRLDYAPAIAAIDAKFAELEASGAVAEGGYSWPDYIARTEGFIKEFVATLADPEASGTAADDAAAWLAQSAFIVELWLMDALKT